GVVERLHGVREVELGEVLLDLGTGGVEPGEDPALLELAGSDLRLRAAALGEEQPRHVPELVRELATLLDRTPGKPDVLGRGVLEQPVTRRVRPEPLDGLERIDAGT